MNNFIKKRFALSELGAKNFCKGMYWTVALDIVLMLPAVFVFLFLDDWLHPILDSRTTALHGVWYYCLLGLSFLAVMYITAIFQYRSTYISVYEESANRRISLAEKLRKLPLAFFGEKKSVGSHVHNHGRLYRSGTYFLALGTAIIRVSHQYCTDCRRLGILQLATYTSTFLGCTHCFGYHSPIEKKNAQKQ